jgi:hypothetical protein
MLFIGWGAILLTGHFLWVAGTAAATESPGGEDVGFEVVGRSEELNQEKRALLKALKEVEFDREMGKMSEADASEISRAYRKRAIEIIKELERRQGADEGETPSEAIERELKARLMVDVSAKKKKPKVTVPGSPMAKRKAEQEDEEAEAEASTSDEVADEASTSDEVADEASDSDDGADEASDSDEVVDEASDSDDGADKEDQ